MAPADTIAYEYDYAIMELTAITDTTMTPGHKTVRYACDAKGRLQTVTYANGARQDYACNSDNRLERLTTRGAAGSLINDHIYHYTPGGILTEISAYQNGSAYQYDALNQVTNETTFIRGGQSGPLYARRAYEYDANGNRTRETRTDVLPNGQTPAVTRGYGSATADDRITSFWDNTPGNPSTSFDYDARGNRLRRTSHVQGQTSFGYDAFSRMTGITNGAVSVEYTYDSLGRKVKRVKRDTTIYPDSTYYVYDGLDPVCVIRFNPASTECTTVTWLLRGLGVAPGTGNIVAQQRYTINFGGAMSQPVTHYYHPNHRGDTAYLTDAAGVTAAGYVYDAFGRLLTATNSALTVYRFSSKEWTRMRSSTISASAGTTRTPAPGPPKTRWASAVAQSTARCIASIRHSTTTMHMDCLHGNSLMQFPSLEQDATGGTTHHRAHK